VTISNGLIRLIGYFILSVTNYVNYVTILCVGSLVLQVWSWILLWVWIVLE